MDPVVLDSSVVLKWYLEEPGAEEALALQISPAVSLHAPDSALIELDSVFCRCARQKRITPGAVRDIRRSVRSSGLRLHPFDSLLEPAFEAAYATGKAVHDCLYLALAERLDATLITADRRFLSGLSDRRIGTRVRLLDGV